MKQSYIDERKAREEFIAAYVKANLCYGRARAAAYAKRIWERDRQKRKEQ